MKLSNALVVSDAMFRGDSYKWKQMDWWGFYGNMETGARWRGTCWTRPALGLRTIAMLPPADKSHVCFLWFVSLVWFSGFFFEQLSPYLLALSDRLTTLEVLRDAGSSVADRPAPCEAALDVGVASNPAEVARRGGRSAGLLLLGEGVVLAGGEVGCWQLVWELLARQLATTAWRNTIDSRRQNNLGAIIGGVYSTKGTVSFYVENFLKSHKCTSFSLSGKMWDKFSPNFVLSQKRAKV